MCRVPAPPVRRDLQERLFVGLEVFVRRHNAGWLFAHFLIPAQNFSGALTQAGKGLIIISPTLSDCSLLLLRDLYPKPAVVPQRAFYLSKQKHIVLTLGLEATFHRLFFLLRYFLP